MKICPNCDPDGMVAYDNRLTVCPVCGRELLPDPYDKPRTVDAVEVIEEVILPQSPPPQDLELPAQVTKEQEAAAPSFHWRERGHDFYRGSVIELTPVIRYASSGTKFLQSLFFGVPYQMTHSTIYMRIRIEEHVSDMTRFPERNLTVEYQSDAEGELTYGDDITVETVTKQRKFIAKKIWVNENSGRRQLGRGLEIPALVIRMAVLMVIAMIIKISVAIYKFFHSLMFSEVMMWLIIMLGIVLAIKSAIGPKRRG